MGVDFPPLMDAGNETVDFFVETPWNSQTLDPLPAASNNLDFNELFQPDTASSFNMPFTTMNNYNWLFDLEQPSLMTNAVPQAQVDMSPHVVTGNSTSSMHRGGNFVMQ